MKSIIWNFGYDYNIEIVKLEIPPDHIHLVVRSEPKTAPSAAPPIIKSIVRVRVFQKISGTIWKGICSGAVMLSYSELLCNS